MEREFNFEDYLIGNGWLKSDNVYRKKNKSIKLIQNNKIMYALNNDPKIKHKHIVTCEVPSTLESTQELFKLTFLK